MSDCGVGINFKPFSSKEISSGVSVKFGWRLQIVVEEVVEDEDGWWEMTEAVWVAVSFSSLNDRDSGLESYKLYWKTSGYYQSLWKKDVSPVEESRDSEE